MDAVLEYYNNHNYTYSWFPYDSNNYDNVSEDISSHNISGYGNEQSFNYNIVTIIAISVFIIICIFGATGNAILIWLLGFCIKRNSFITYILNLAIADFGLLVSIISIIVSEWLLFLYDFTAVFFLLSSLFLSMYSADQFLLTAIGIDRCVAVFFPLCHQCHGPPHLPAILRLLIWVLSFLVSAIACTNVVSNPNKSMIPIFFQLIWNAVCCLPVMTTAAVALSTKVCFKAKQYRRGKLLTIILLTLLCFLLFAFPLKVICILHVYNYVPLYLANYAILLSCLNSSIHPIIYFLVGRQKKPRCRETLTMILSQSI